MASKYIKEFRPLRIKRPDNNISTKKHFIDVAKDSEEVEKLFSVAFAECYGELLTMAAEYLQKNPDDKDMLVSLYDEWQPLSYNATKQYMELPVNILSEGFETTLEQTKIGSVLLMALSFDRALQKRFSDAIPKTNNEFRVKVCEILCGSVPGLKPLLTEWSDDSIQKAAEYLIDLAESGKNKFENRYEGKTYTAVSIIALNILGGLDEYTNESTRPFVYAVTAFITKKYLGLEKWQYKLKIAEKTGGKNQTWNRDLWDTTKIKDFKDLAEYYDKQKKDDVSDLMTAVLDNKNEKFPKELLIPGMYVNCGNMICEYAGNLMTKFTYTKKERIEILNFMLSSSRRAIAEIPDDLQETVKRKVNKNCIKSITGYTLGLKGDDLENAKMFGYKAEMIASSIAFYSVIKTAKKSRVDDILYYLRKEANIEKSAASDTNVLLNQNEEAEKKIRELEEKYERIIQEKDAVIEKYRKAEKAESGAKGHIERLEQDNKELSEECSILRDLLAEYEEKIPEVQKSIKVEKTIPSNQICQLIENASTKHKIFIIGGNENLMKKVGAKYPGLQWYHTRRMSEWDYMLADADLILFKTDCLGHTNYAKAKSVAGSHNIKYDYLKTVTSIELLERDIVDKFMENGLITEDEVTGIKRNIIMEGD